MVGTQIKVVSKGQTVNTGASSAPVSTNSIRVTGVGISRQFNISVSSANFSGSTVALEQSVDDTVWTTVETYTSSTFKTYADADDNAIYYYRLTCSAYGGVVVSMTLSYSGGGIDGIGEITQYVSPTSVDCKVLQDFGQTGATKDWYMSQWKDSLSQPTCVHLYEGRLWFAGNTRLWGSESDEYGSFDREILGDSASIFRTIGFGAVESVEWLDDAGRMIMGIASDEIAVRSSSFGEVLTNFNCNLRSGTNQGAAPVQPVKIDNSIFFVQRSKRKVMRSTYSLQSDSQETLDLMTLHEDIAIDGIKRIVVSRQPETRVYVLLNTGELRVFLYDPAEEINAWSRITLAGSDTVKDIVALPAEGEDEVYIATSRASITKDVAGSMEKFQRIGEFIDKHLDASVTLTSQTTTISGLPYADTTSVAVWADGQDRGDYTVTSGAITVPASYSDVNVGIRYVADYKSNKLGQYAKYSVLSERVRVYSMGILGRDIYPSSIQFGGDFSTLEPMPKIEDGQAVVQTTTFNEYDYTPIEFNGVYDTNSRVVIRASNPCTIMALTYHVKDSVNQTPAQR
jgi:hypothetical protein